LAFLPQAIFIVDLFQTRQNQVSQPEIQSWIFVYSSYRKAQRIWLATISTSPNRTPYLFFPCKTKWTLIKDLKHVPVYKISRIRKAPRIDPRTM
jgi:hypothetical protein